MKANIEFHFEDGAIISKEIETSECTSVDSVLNSPNLNTENGSIIAKDWNELKQMSKDFYINAPVLEQDQLDNAYKCFVLAYMSFDYPDTLIGKIQKDVEGPAIFRMMSQRHTDCFFKAQLKL